MSDALDTCGCRSHEELQPAVFNRPGLAALEYRIGSHGTLLRRMLRRIAEWSPPEDQGKRPLATLTTRVLDDPAIALLDAWAITGDVLGFYQERIANEGFLRTATERRSVLELAREIGYELNPGVAASTHLAWEVEQSFAVAGQTPPGMAPPPRTVLVATGTKVQSMPGQDELPQTFETSAELVARSDYNALRPRLTVPQPVSLGSTELFVDGIATGFVRGDRVLITAPRIDGGDGVDFSFLEITDAVPEPERGRTRLALHAVGKLPPAPQPPLPTIFPVTPDDPFIPPAPPPSPPVAPAVTEPPIFVLLPRPLTAKEIEERLLDFAWRNAALMAQIALLGWNPFAVIDYLARHRVTLDLGPVFEWTQVVPARDVTHPTVISVFPPDKGEAAPNTVVTVTFSEPMEEASVKGAVTLERLTNPSGLVNAGKSYNAATGTLTLTPPGDLSSPNTDVEYRVTVEQTAKDVGTPVPNELAAKVVTTFTVPDRTPPELITTDPLAPGPDDTDVPVTTNVIAKFDEELANVNDKSFFLRDATGTLVPADYELLDDGRTAVLEPRAPLARSMRYTATLTNGITDVDLTDPNPIFPAEWSFTTVARDPVVPTAELAVYGFREKTAFFGHNAPRWASLPKPDSPRDGDPWEYSWDDPPRSVWVDSQGSSLGGDSVQLDREVRDLEPGGWTIFETATGAAVYFVTNASAQSVADYSMSGRASRLVLSQRDGSSPCEGAGAPADFRVRETAAHVRSERLRLVELPIEDDLEADDTEIVLDGMVLGLDRGRLIALRGELVDLPGAIGDEILEVEESFHAGGFTTLVLRKGLARSYVRKTVTLNANVVPATHGESVGREVLGGGDGSRPNQRFALRRPPLTHVSAQNPSGAASTLEVRVDGVRWDEAPVLYGLGPRSRSYIVRAGDDGVPAVIFGDGERGARPPTGTENIVATYRSGIGLVGLLGAGRLTLLRERPLGISGVTNRLPTSGAAEPEDRDAARENAPLTVLTMERIVSLRDFEDFARGFAGIGKAQAIAVWRGDRQLVHVTVAAVNGALDEDSALFENLVATVAASSEPGLDVSVRSFRPRFFDLEAAVRVDPAYLAADVLAAARSAVLDAFSFKRRAFGQPVTAAEIVHVVEGVPGVVATYLDALYQLADEVEMRLEEDVERPLEPVLPAQQARLVGAAIEPAELLLVNPAGVTITERTA